MNAPAIKKVIHIRFRRLKRYYARMENGMGVEDIHHFRVEVKKLRAFLRMLGEKEKKIKIPGSLKKVYKKAGAVRELQLHEQTIKAAHARSARHTTILLEHAIKELKNEMTPHLVQLAKMKVEKKLPACASTASIRDFHNKKLAAIREIIQESSISDKQLHTIRKYVKDILYNAKSFETDLRQGYPILLWTNKKEQYYIALADELGKIQDICTELRHLQSSQHNASPEEKKTAENLYRRQQEIKGHLVQSMKVKYTNANQSIPAMYL